MLGRERCERCSGDKEGELEKIGSRLEVAGRRRDEEEGRVNDLVVGINHERGLCGSCTCCLEAVSVSATK